MFLGSPGKNNYDKCGHKEILTSDSIVNPSNSKTFFVAELVCPNPNGNGLKTEGTRVESSRNYTAEVTRRDLRQIAAREACGNCALSGMTRTELYTRQAEEARAEIANMEAQKLLAEARKAQQLLMEQAAQEVNGINEANLGIDAQPVRVPPLQAEQL